MSIDEFLDRVPRPGYNCLDFTREVWLKLRHEDITEKLTQLVGEFSQRHPTVSGIKKFRRLNSPINPCFVVMQRFKCIPHIGLWIDDRVLHMHAGGVQFQPLSVARFYFTRIGFYR